MGLLPVRRADGARRGLLPVALACDLRGEVGHKCAARRRGWLAQQLPHALLERGAAWFEGQRRYGKGIAGEVAVEPGVRLSEHGKVVLALQVSRHLAGEVFLPLYPQADDRLATLAMMRSPSSAWGYTVE